MKRTCIAMVAGLAGLAGPASASDQPTLAMGQQVYADHCAACHGADLEGQSDWKRPLSSGRMPAPPHDATGHTWHHSDDVLFRLTRDGVAAVVGRGYESDMPGFADVLSDDEIRAVLEFIKSTWPRRERAFQAEVTQNERDAAAP